MINKPYRLNRKDFDEILITSDQHYGHRPNWEVPIWATRGFASPDDHEQWLEDQYANVSENSLIISLGDPALNSTPDKLLEFFNKTKANIWHIWGNHFSNDYTIYKRALNKFNNVQDHNAPLKYEVYPLTVERTSFSYVDLGFPTDGRNSKLIFLGSQCDVIINHDLFHLTHMAPLIWTRRSMCLHGHSHGELRGAQPDDVDDGKKLDCGIENSIKYNGTAFFKYEDVIQIMARKNNKTYDNHS